jgi:serine/threonine protein kinase
MAPQPAESSACNALHAFELGPTIGKGSFGEVKVAINIHTAQEVAIKIIDKGSFEDDLTRQQLAEEVRLHKFLSHPNVVRLYDVIDTDSHIYIILELIEGQELCKYLSTRDELSEDEARRFFRQILDGVQHCHDRMVSHRDLKLENIMLDCELNCHLVDFGLAAEIREGELLTRSCGSLEYVAPEIISSQNGGYEGAKVDVWSCGVLLFALLSGRLPFRAETAQELEELILEGRCVFPDFISDEARDLLHRMLCKETASRISLPEIRKHCWFNGDRFKEVSSPGEPTTITTLPPHFQSDLQSESMPTTNGSESTLEMSPSDHLGGLTSPSPLESHDSILPKPNSPALLSPLFVLQELGRPVPHKRASSSRIRVCSNGRRLRFRAKENEIYSDNLIPKEHKAGRSPSPSLLKSPSKIPRSTIASTTRATSSREEQNPTMLASDFVLRELGKPTPSQQVMGCSRGGRRLRFLRAAQRRTDFAC